MRLMNEIPDRFWSLFRSVNRPVYIEALLKINEEYEYSNYFLSREACIRILGEHFARKKYVIWQDELEDELDTLEPPATRVLGWLLRAGWLRKVDDYASMTANIVIPDYAAVMLEAFRRLHSDEEDETQIYIQNIYAILFSLKNDRRAGLSLLGTALVNTKKLNKTLQDMLHNMDKFFERLLDHESYGELLREHLDGYVEEIVKKKYHILKTSDNFYIYKMDIKKCLRDMRENEEWIESIRQKAKAAGDTKEDVLDLLDLIERGFDDIEHRISNMDREHSKYVRATVSRMNYLLSGETDTKGLVVQLLNKISAQEEPERLLTEAGKRMNLSLFEMISEKSLYKRRKQRTDFISQMGQDEEYEDLNREDVLKLNRIQMRYSRQEIEDFIEEHMENEVMDAGTLHITEETAFEKLILAYDYSTRKNSKYRVLNEDETVIQSGQYQYPALKFVRRRPQ